MAKLGEVCTIVSGSTPKTSVTSYWDGNIKWITPAELNEDTFYIMDSVRHITEEGKEKTGLSYLPTGTVILSSRAPIGKTAIAGCEMCCNQGFKNLICSDVIYNEYLYFFLKSKTDYLNSLGRGATFKEISKSIVESIEIPLPEVNQQKEIAEKFKKLEQLISLRKQQLAKLDELVKARFVEMFGEPVQNPNCWKTENLLDLGYCKNGMNFHRDDCGTEIHCLGVGDFKNHSTIRDVGSLPFISLNELPTSEYLLQDGDIVFVRSNGNKELVGRCLAIYPAKIPVTYSGFCIRYRLTSNKITVSYLLRVLKADSVRKKMTGRGANIQNLNQQILAQLVVPIPPLSLQNQFAAFVERVDQQKQTVQQSLEKLELMKKALMQEYFG